MELQSVIETILSRRARVPHEQGMLVAITGIDASGKTTIANRMAEQLNERYVTTALIHLDQWHAPPSVRFSRVRPAEHFYQHAFRFDELFDTIIHPLKRGKSVHARVQLTRLPENDLYEYRYDLDGVGIIVLEGIFLLKRELRTEYDLSFWAECAFDTALERAVQRNQEGLSPAEIVSEYESIYFPAQRIHDERDQPRLHANGVIDNTAIA